MITDASGRSTIGFAVEGSAAPHPRLQMLSSCAARSSPPWPAPGREAWPSIAASTESEKPDSRVAANDFRPFRRDAEQSLVSRMELWSARRVRIRWPCVPGRMAALTHDMVGRREDDLAAAVAWFDSPGETVRRPPSFPGASAPRPRGDSPAGRSTVRRARRRRSTAGTSVLSGSTPASQAAAALAVVPSVGPFADCLLRTPAGPHQQCWIDA